MLYRVIHPVIGEKDISDLTPLDRDKIIQKGLSIAHSVPRSAVVTFRRVLKYAKHNRHWFSFDVDDIEIPTYRRKKDTEALNIQELNQIRSYLNSDPEFEKHASLRVQEIAKHSRARTRCLFEFLLHTGLRLSEALSVNIQDINFETKELRIENCKDQGTWSTVYLHGTIDAINFYLKYRQDENPALFVSGTGVRLCRDTAKSYLRLLKKDLFLKKNLTHHLFRRTFITTLLRNGVDLKTAQMLGRYNSLAVMLDHYYEVEKEKLKPTHARIMEYV